MKIRSFNQFIEWYVAALTDREIDQSYKDLVSKFKWTDSPSKPAIAEKKKAIIGWWKNKTRGLMVSEYFKEKLKHNQWDFEGNTRDEIRNRVEQEPIDLDFRNMLFYLCTNNDQYTQKIVFELANNRDPMQIRTSIQENEPSPKRNAVNIPGTFKRIIKAIAEGQFQGDFDEIDALLSEFTIKWEQHKDDFGKRKQAEAKMITILNMFTEEVIGTLRYLKLDSHLILDAQVYMTTDEKLMEQITESLHTIIINCEKYEEIRSRKHVSAEEEDKANQDRNSIRQEITRLIGSLADYTQATTESVKEDTVHLDESPESVREVPDTSETDQGGMGFGPEMGKEDIERATPEPLTSEYDENAGIQSQLGKTEVDNVTAEPLRDTTVICQEESEDAFLNDFNDNFLKEDKDNGTISEMPEISTGSDTFSSPPVEMIIDKTTERAQVVEPIYETSCSYTSLISQGVLEGDLSTPYWLCREVENATQETNGKRILSWVFLAALLAQSSEWTDIEEKDILFGLCEQYPEPVKILASLLGESENITAYLMGAISLRPVFYAPETSALTWLDDAIKHIKSQDDLWLQFFMPLKKASSSYGTAMNQRSLRGLNWSQSWKQRSEEQVANIRDWKQRFRNHRRGYPRASIVLKNLIDSDQSPFQDAFQIIENNEIKDIHKVRNVYDEFLSDGRKISKLIRDTDEEMYGKAAQQLSRHLSELGSYFHDWIESASFGIASIDGESWFDRQVEEIRHNLQKIWPQLEQNTRRKLQLLNDDDNHIENAQFWMLNLAFRLTSIFVADFLKPHSMENDLHVLDWKDALRMPLLILPHPPIEDDTKSLVTKAIEWEQSLSDLMCENSKPMEVFLKHLDRYDFLAAENVIQKLMPEEMLRTQCQKELRVKEYEVQQRLRDDIRETRNILEQATIDHVLSEEDRSNFNVELLTVESLDTKRQYLQFDALKKIRDDIDEKRAKRQESLGINIEVLVDEIKSKGGVSELGYWEKVEEFLTKAQEALNNGKLPVADEYLHFAEQIIDTGTVPEIVSSKSDGHYVREFAANFTDIMRLFRDQQKPTEIINDLSRGKSYPGLNMKRVPGARYEEIKEGLMSWLRMKSNASQVHLVKILKYMGFQHPEPELVRSDNKSTHYTVRMSAGSISPLADFGSQRNNQYDVLAVYDRPNEDTIAQLIQEYKLAGRFPIILFLGRMTSNQRQEWSLFCKIQRLTAMMVDELLMYYLATQRESRLPAAVSCGVAWGYAMPYRSFGLIPPEIFRGREDMISELISPQGSCIVYGGRQLGKSALLHTVQRQYHTPDRDFYVIYDDIRNLGDPQGIHQTAEVWSILRERLIGHGVLNKKASDDQAKLVEQVVDAFQMKPQMRILLLLDEADNFLSKDAANNFEVLHGLRRLMDRTDRRFKAVVCGLHSVQRYCSGENHPFAQMMSADPLVVGPLSPKGALSLISEPLTAIGFDMQDSEAYNAMLQILSYTNYHPALIQHFCSELIKLVRKSHEIPPYKISIADVEAVYRKKEVRSFMRERFNWTIDLDPRYTVMVYTMVQEQLYDHDGYRREFTPMDIMKLATQSWPEGFKKLPPEEFKSLLKELMGLGVLVQRDNGNYRLRNGNVVRALGSEQEIADRIEDLASQPPPPRHTDAHNLRLVIGDTVEQRSPLTVKQAGDLTTMQSGVGIVFGSKALGVSGVPATLKYIAGSRPEDSSIVYETIPPEMVTYRQIRDRIDTLLKRRLKRKIILYSQADQLDSRDMPLTDFMFQMSYHLKQQRKRPFSLKWITAFDAKMAYEWFIDEKTGWQQVENQVDAVVTLSRWDEEMIKRFLSDAEIPNTQQIIERIMKVTGGWPFLLSEVWKSIRRNRDTRPDPRTAADQLDQRMEQNHEDILNRFVSATGIYDVPGGHELIQVFNKLDYISWDDLQDAIALQPENFEPGSYSQAEAGARTLNRMGILVDDMKGLIVEPVFLGAVNRIEKLA